MSFLFDTRAEPSGARLEVFWSSSELFGAVRGGLFGAYRERSARMRLIRSPYGPVRGPYGAGSKVPAREVVYPLIQII